MLKEKLHIFGILGCVLCVVGSTTIVLHAPQERTIESVAEVWDLATEPGTLLSYPISCYQILITPLRHIISVRANAISFGLAAFLSYAVIVLAATFVLIYYFIPQYGQTHIMVYIGVCSLVGSLSVCVLHIHLALVLSICICLSDYALILFPFKMCWCWQVMSVKALGIALKLTFSGMNQLIYLQTWLFTIVVVACIVTQMNYLNKVIVIFHFNGISTVNNCIYIEH